MDYVELLVRQVRQILGDDLLKMPGGVFYSSRDTLKRGQFYMMGHNPGGQQNEKETIDKDIHQWINRPLSNWSAYFFSDDQWNDKGEVPHQRRVQELGELLLGTGQGIRDIFSANAIFVRTPASHMLNILPFNSDYRERCWQAHKVFLGIVKPTLIVCLGNDENVNASSFSLMKKWTCTQDSNVTREDCRNQVYRRARYLKWFDAKIALGSDEDQSTLFCRIVGVPHPSRFEIVKLEKLGSRLKEVVPG